VLSTSLSVMSMVFAAGYIDEFEYVDDHRSGKIVVQLNGRLNKASLPSLQFWLFEHGGKALPSATVPLH
jgi:ribosomal protein S8